MEAGAGAWRFNTEQDVGVISDYLPPNSNQIQKGK